MSSRTPPHAIDALDVVPGLRLQASEDRLQAPGPSTRCQREERCASERRPLLPKSPSRDGGQSERLGEEPLQLPHEPRHDGDLAFESGRGGRGVPDVREVWGGAQARVPNVGTRDASDDIESLVFEVPKELSVGLEEDVHDAHLSLEPVRNDIGRGGSHPGLDLLQEKFARTTGHHGRVDPGGRGLKVTGLGLSTRNVEDDGVVARGPVWVRAQGGGLLGLAVPVHEAREDPMGAPPPRVGRIIVPLWMASSLMGLTVFALLRLFPAG